MARKLIAGPAEEPVSLAELKEQVRIDADQTAEDALLRGLITAARDWMEAFTRRALVTQTWELVMDAFPSKDEIELPLPPLQSVTSIKYKVDGGTEYTLSSSSYIVDADVEPGRVVLEDGAAWPGDTLYESSGVRVRFVCGYGDAEDVPQALRQAILMLAGHLYENREATTAPVPLAIVPFGVEALAYPYRHWGF